MLAKSNGDTTNYNNCSNYGRVQAKDIGSSNKQQHYLYYTFTMSSTPTQSLKSDEISRRIFYGGMFGLPWLWIVHTWGWYSKQRAEGAPSDNVDREELMVAENEEMWVKRCQSAAILVTTAWVAWIVVAQVVLSNKLPDSWYVRAPDQADYTGW